MRKVNRTMVLAPDVLCSEKGPGAVETARAIAFFSKLFAKANNTQSDGSSDAVQSSPPQFSNGATSSANKTDAKADKFTFAAYSAQAVRQALEQLFEHKCAYCESRYAATQPVDVEHWRPKARIDEESGKVCRPGYFWLAASWSNLLPSCIDCNRMRKQKLFARGPERTVGKGNRFPLEDESKRAREPGKECEERPLLLNPYEDEPAEHLEYLFDGDSITDGIVRPRLDETGKPSLKAQKSIEVYALNRTELVQDRREVLRLMQRHMHTVLTLSLLVDRRTRAKEKMLLEDLLSHELEALADFRRPDRPYSLMAIQVTDEFIKILTGKKKRKTGSASQTKTARARNGNSARPKMRKRVKRGVKSLTQLG